MVDDDELQRQEARFEQLLGNLLRIGVLVSAAVVLVGGVFFLLHHAGDKADHKKFHGEPAELRTLAGIFADALHPDGRGLIQLGLVLLIATPVARVVFSVFGFLRERDWIYVGLTLFVLIVLLGSLFFGAAI